MPLHGLCCGGYGIIGGMLKPMSTNTCDFEALRKAGHAYVDKTAYLHRLVADPNRSFYFIARPRRFGKSLADAVAETLA